MIPFIPPAFLVETKRSTHLEELSLPSFLRIKDWGLPCGNLKVWQLTTVEGMQDPGES